MCGFQLALPYVTLRGTERIIPHLWVYVLRFTLSLSIAPTHRDSLLSHRTADDFEFEEPAFEGAVEEGRATAGCQTD